MADENDYYTIKAGDLFWFADEIGVLGVQVQGVSTENIFGDPREALVHCSDSIARHPTDLMMNATRDEAVALYRHLHLATLACRRAELTAAQARVRLTAAEARCTAFHEHKKVTK